MAAPKKHLKDKYAPLLTLPPEKLQYINNLIFKENKIVKVIKILQEDYGIYHNYKPATLRQYLHRYKADLKDTWYKFNLDATVHTSQEIPTELLSEVPTHAGDPKLASWIPYAKVKVLLQEAVTKFDAMQELERVAMMQYDRVLKVLEYEQNLPTEIEDKDGKMKPNFPLGKGVRYELESLHTMLKNIITLQMDLGIRHKVEQVQNHLHVSLEPHQQKLMKDFNDMQRMTDVTTKALEIITGNKYDNPGRAGQPVVIQDEGTNE